MADDYKDIINLPHHQSKNHPHMSMYERSAQFSPFAALTGHEEAVKETARLTSEKEALSEDEKATLNEKLEIICDNIGRNENYIITYFLKDKLKSGGEYRTTENTIRRIDTVDGILVLGDRSEIKIEDILNIEGNIFKEYSL